MEPIRQLSAILFTDIVGFSAQMREDESAAIGQLEAVKRVQKPLVEKYHGQWIKNLGDGAIIIFNSVYNALQCALEIQHAVFQIDGLEMKVALHSGEVILRDGDVFGDGVNVTARIEQVARGNSILISDKARQEIRNHHDIHTVSLGKFHFKNIDQPIGLFAVSGQKLTIPDLSDEPSAKSNQEKEVLQPTTAEQFEQRVRDLIRANLSDPDFGVAELCREAGVSRPQLYRKLQAHTGMSPSDLIREMRLRHAAELLKGPSGNVSDAAYQSGFQSLSHFSKAFQKRFGKPPSAYAKSVPARTEVPAPLNPFIGREQEMADIKALLKEARLLTLTGIGGTGKTRLAVEVLREVEDQFPEGAFFVPLAPVSSADQVLPKIAQVLKVSQDPAKQTSDALIEFFAGKQNLLVLDNFEHVLAAASEVLNLLGACPGLKVLTTSRVNLNLNGEYEYPVPNLQLPDADEVYTLRDLTAFHAIRFFVDRVKAVKHPFALTEENMVAVTGICRTLDGLPLALELAAVRMKLFSPDALLKRLATNLEILKNNAPDLPARHRSLINAIDWSYSLLPPGDQTLFRRLSVFSGGFTLESANAVCFLDYGDENDLMDSIARLLDQSLLHQQNQPDGEPRFYMLETIKAFGQSRLKRSFEFEELMEKYAGYFQQKFADGEKQLTGPDMPRWLRYIELELDNLRAILFWMEKRSEAERGLRFALSFWRYWIIRSMLREGMTWMQRMLDIPVEKQETLLRCKALNAYGMLFGITRKLFQAKEVFIESLRIARSLDSKPVMGQALNYLAWAHHHSLEFEACDRYSAEALVINQESGNQRNLAATLNNMGWVAKLRGQLPKSTDHFQQAGQIMNSIGDIRGYAYNHINVAFNHMLCGDYEWSEKCCEEALRILDEIEDHQLQAYVHSVKAYIHCYLGNSKQVFYYTQVADTLWDKSGNSYARGFTDICRAMAYLHQKDHVSFQAIAKSFDAALNQDKWHAFWLRHLKTRFNLETGNSKKGLAGSKENVRTFNNHELGIFLPDELALLAQLLLHAEGCEKALYVFAFSESLREESKIEVPFVWKEKHEEVRDRLQGCFSEEAFQVHWQKGKTLNMEQVLDML